MGHEAIWCRPRTSIPDATHRKYPYLLRDLEVVRPDQVCGAPTSRTSRCREGMPSCAR
jgi:putative transposase